jgi:hypothetical protein
MISLIFLLFWNFSGIEYCYVFANNSSQSGTSDDSDTKEPKNISISNDDRWIAVKPEMFSKIDKLSGAGNYYTILSDSLGGHLIHADYHPLHPVVKLGYAIPATISTDGKIAWDWRIITPPHGSSEKINGKNDSGCSVYLIFNELLMTYIIKYVYSETLPVGTVVIKDLMNPMQKMYMIVAGSLKISSPGNWEHVETNYRGDFKLLFKKNVCPPLAGIGILSDGDQTSSEVVAEYRNFLISKTE